MLYNSHLMCEPRAVKRTTTEQISTFFLLNEYTYKKLCHGLFGLNVVFNNISVISRHCLVATGSSVLTFIVLSHL